MKPTPDSTQKRPNRSSDPDPAAEAAGTQTQSRPNRSTEHQQTGDARRPSDTLDRGQEPPHRDVPRKTSLTDGDRD